MSKIAVFFHCIISDGERPIDKDYALNLIASQMTALQDSGLSDACHYLCVGVNGDEVDSAAVSMLCPKKADIVTHGKTARTEITTLNLIQRWLPEHRGWNVLYHHTKGVSTPNQADGWRRRMERHCVWNWQECLKLLDNGFEAVGCHWLTPEGHGSSIGSPFFGGTFWWAKADYLLTLPPLPEPIWANRYEAETWIGKGPRRPRVKDLYPGWPSVS